MIALTNRQKEILLYLTEQQDFVKTQAIAQRWGVTSRTIRNDLEMIDSYLKEKQLHLVKKPRKGILINLGDQAKEELTKEVLQAGHCVATKIEFIYMLAVRLLLENQTTLEELAESLITSKNKVFLYMPEAEELLKKYNAKVEKKPYLGIKIVGNEVRIRNAFSQLYLEAISSTSLTSDYFFQLFHKSDIKKSQRFISFIESKLLSQYSDHSCIELTLMICYHLNRIQNHYFVKYPLVKIQESQPSREYQAIMEGYPFVFQQALKADEITFLTEQIKGAKLTNYSPSFDEANKEEQYWELTQLFVNEAEKLVGIDFREDFEFINGLAVHLKVALHRLLNNQIIENPLTEQVKYKYRYIYEITKKILLKIEHDYQISFPAEEIAYIAMHLGASFERHSHSGFMPTALVVCSSGLATSSILVTRLKLLLPELRIIGPFTLSKIDEQLEKENIDLVISTVPFRLERFDVIVVNPLLDHDDLLKLRNMTFNLTYRKQMKHLVQQDQLLQKKKQLKDIIPEASIQLNVDATEWRSAIQLASSPLLEKKIITKKYVQAMIEAVEELGPYMVFIPEIAFVHASPKSGALKNGISLMTLTNPIFIGDKSKVKVQIIIVFSSTHPEADILIDLVQILEDSSSISKIKSALTSEDVLTL